MVGYGNAGSGAYVLNEAMSGVLANTAMNAGLIGAMQVLASIFFFGSLRQQLEHGVGPPRFGGRLASAVCKGTPDPSDILQHKSVRRLVETRSRRFSMLDSP